MKTILSFVLMLVMLFSVAGAEDLGVQVIGGDSVAAVATSLDDMQLGTTYTLEGYAIVAPKEMKFVDCFAQFGENDDYSVYRKKDSNVYQVFSHSESELGFYGWRYSDAAWMESGDSAEFAWLLMDITNLQKRGVEFTDEITVKVVYQDEYEFNGWVRQIVYDHMDGVNGNKGLSRVGYDKASYPNEIVMNPAKVEAIDMMYTGTYAFGCTLPNYVIEDKKAPLRIEIKLGENDLTYHIRK